MEEVCGCGCDVAVAVYYLILDHAEAIFCMCEPAVPCQSWPADRRGGRVTDTVNL